MPVGMGGGMGFRPIGGASVVLTVDDRAYWAKMADARRGLRDFAANARQAVAGAANVLSGLNLRPLIGQVNQLGIALRNVARVAGQVRGAMPAVRPGGIPAGIPAAAPAGAPGQAAPRVAHRADAAFDRANMQAAREADRAAQQALVSGMLAARAQLRSQAAFDRANARVAREADRAAQQALVSGMAAARKQAAGQGAFDRANARIAREADRAAQEALVSGMMHARDQLRSQAAFDRANVRIARAADQAARQALADGMASTRARLASQAAFDRANMQVAREADRAAQQALAAGMASARDQLRSRAAFDRENARVARAADQAARQALAAGIAQARTARQRGQPLPAAPVMFRGGYDVAQAGQAVLSGLAARVRAASQAIGAWGQRTKGRFDALASAFAGIGNQGLVPTGQIAGRGRQANRMISRVGEAWAGAFFGLANELARFDLRGGITGRVATGIQSFSRSVSGWGASISRALQDAGMLFSVRSQVLGSITSHLGRSIGSATSVISGYFQRIGVTFQGISNLVPGPWRALSGISLRITQGILSATTAVSTFGDRIGISLRAISQRFPAPWKALSSGTSVIGNAIGKVTDAAQAFTARMAASLGNMAQKFGSAGGTIGSVGTGILGGVSEIAGIGSGLASGLASGLMGVIPVIGIILNAGVGMALNIGKSLLSALTLPFRVAWDLGTDLFGMLFRNIGQLSVIAGGVGGALSLAYVIQQVRDMESNLVALQRVTGGTNAEIREMARSFNDMGTTLAGVDLNTIFDIAQMGARLGVPREQLNLFSRDLARTSAILDDLPVDELAQRSSGLIDVFQLQYTDTIRLTSALNALDIASNASARDILDITGRLSGAASTLGLTAQQTLALATAMRQARVPVETAGTAMSQILGRMTSATMPEFARVAGLSVGRFRQVLEHDALQALVAVERGLGRLDPISRFRALDRLRLDGQRVRLVMLQLIPILPRLTQYLGIANEEWETTNSVMQGFALQANTADAMFKRMWNNIQLTAVSLGTFFLPVLKGAAEGVGNLAADIRKFLDSHGGRLTAWGESVGNVFRGLGAAIRVNWGDIAKILGTSLLDVWTQFGANARVSFNNIVRIGSNAVDQLAAYMAQAIPPAIQRAMLTVFETLAGIVPKRMAALIGLPDPKVIAAIKNLLPEARPAGDFLNARNLLQGAVPLPGLRLPPGLAAIPQMFGAQVAGQQQEQVRREAIANLGDMFVRWFAGRGRRGGEAPDPMMARLQGLAQMEDQGGGAMGGLGGIGGIGAGAPGVPGGLAGALGGLGGGGAAGAVPDFAMGGGGAPAPAVAPRVPDRPRRGFAQRAGDFLAGGLLGVLGAGSPDPHQGHMELLAWRQRMQARRPQNPWAEFRENLAEAQQQQWMMLGGGRVAAGRNRRREALRRLEAMRRTNMEGREGVAGNIREQFGRDQVGTPLGFGQNLAAALGVGPRQNLVMNEPRAFGNVGGGLARIIPENIPDRVDRPLAGVPAIEHWSKTAIGHIDHVVEAIYGLQETMDNLARQLPIPRFQ